MKRLFWDELCNTAQIGRNNHAVQFAKHARQELEQQGVKGQVI
ncbi:hypothetical protein MKX73_08925 [Solibacillus sp. FSL W7-1436]|nr:hypothetical protein [Solibacillus isronensis]